MFDGYSWDVGWENRHSNCRLQAIHIKRYWYNIYKNDIEQQLMITNNTKKSNVKSSILSPY